MFINCINVLFVFLLQKEVPKLSSLPNRTSGDFKTGENYLYKKSAKEENYLPKKSAINEDCNLKKKSSINQPKSAKTTSKDFQSFVINQSKTNNKFINTHGPNYKHNHITPNTTTSVSPYIPIPSTVLLPAEAGIIKYQTYNILKTTSANFHQGSTIFPQAGRQCTCMALLALCHLQNKMQIISTDLDEILYEGNDLYCQIITKMKINNEFQHNYLLFSELPQFLTSRTILFHIQKQNPFYGHSKHLILGTDLWLSLRDITNSAFKCSNTNLFMYGQYAASIFKRPNNTYCCFDSHARDEIGQISHNGKCVLLNFPTQK